MPLGLVLFAHGARDERWAEPFYAILERVRAASSVPVELAFLEMMAPSLDLAVDALLRQGVSSIRVVPVFLGQGSHLRRDLPELIEKIRKAHPQLSISAVQAAGEAPAVLDALAAYCLQNIRT